MRIAKDLKRTIFVLLFVAGMVSFSLMCHAKIVSGATTITVPAGGDFQAALNAAQPGDTIVLEAGATYTTDYGFVLPYKPPVTNTDADYITITTSNPAGIPSPGIRVDPRIHAAAMPKLVVRANNIAIQAQAKAHHWKFVGIEMTNDGTADTPGLIWLGAYIPYTDRLQMKGFTFDRLFLHPAEISATNLVTPERTSMERAVTTGVTDLKLINSYVAGGGPIMKYAGETGNGIAFGDGAGPGPNLVENNYLEGFYAPLFYGGADGDPLPEHKATIEAGATIGQATLSSVTDITVGDYVAFQLRPIDYDPRYMAWGVGKITAVNGKTLSFDPQYGTPGYQGFDIPPMGGGQAQWKGTVIHDLTLKRNMIVAARPGFRYLLDQGRYPKSWFEIKAGVNLTIDGNIFQSDIPTNIAFYPQNQNGGFPWVEVSNVSLTNNWIRNSAYAIAVALGAAYNFQPKDQSHDILISNNLIEGGANSDMGPGSGGSRFFHALHSGKNITVIHNTVLNNGTIGIASAPPIPGLIIRDNIMRNGEYGLTCEAPYPDGGTWGPGCFTGATFTGNVVVDNRSVAAKGYPLPYPAGNWYPDEDAGVGWVDAANGDYRLSSSSPYKSLGSNGTDPGVDMDALLAALGGTSCAFSISSASASFSASGGSGSVNVDSLTGSACGWMASSNVGWISVTTGAVGSGDGEVSYSVTANTDSSSRSGTLTIAGETFTVNQEGSSSDSGPPSIPAGLQTTVISSSQINLSWAASTDDVAVAGYRIYRSGREIGTTAETTYEDTGLRPKTTYKYQVAAYDDAGNISNKSKAISKATQPLPSAKFSVGDRVQVTGKQGIRSTPSSTGTPVGNQTKGAAGTVTGGPWYANSTWWWQIDFDQDPDGWVSGNKIKK